MPLSTYALDTFAAQELSQLTQSNAGPVRADFPGSDSWLSGFVLTSMLLTSLPAPKRAFAFALIRRAEAAIDDYEAAREELAKFIAGGKSISGYFRCLRKFESAIAMIYQALDFGRKALGTKLFTQGDGSRYERLNQLYNKGKHADPELLPADHLHAVWLRNDGLHADGVHLTFDELRDLIREVGRIADKLAKGELPSQGATVPSAPAS